MKLTQWICSLDETIQSEIKSDIEVALNFIDNKEYKADLVNAALNSRLCDLEDTIDISKYL